jgi:hypothetical protein
MANKLPLKDKRFLKDIITVSTSAIKNIHKIIDTAPHVSLMQVLTSWQSAAFPDRNLFISADEYRDNVNFTFHKDVQEEASNTIPLLSLILEGKYSPRAWEWFHDEARDYTTGFYYDPVTTSTGKSYWAQTRDTSKCSLCERPNSQRSQIQAQNTPWRL